MVIKRLKVSLNLLIHLIPDAINGSLPVKVLSINSTHCSSIPQVLLNKLLQHKFIFGNIMKAKPSILEFPGCSCGLYREILCQGIGNSLVSLVTQITAHSLGQLAIPPVDSYSLKQGREHAHNLCLNAAWVITIHKQVKPINKAPNVSKD